MKGIPYIFSAYIVWKIFQVVALQVSRVETIRQYVWY